MPNSFNCTIFSWPFWHGVQISSTIVNDCQRSTIINDLWALHDISEVNGHFAS